MPHVVIFYGNHKQLPQNITMIETVIMICGFRRLTEEVDGVPPVVVVVEVIVGAVPWTNGAFVGDDDGADGGVGVGVDATGDLVGGTVVGVLVGALLGSSVGRQSPKTSSKGKAVHSPVQTFPNCARENRA